jgi:hypothetical protein
LVVHNNLVHCIAEILFSQEKISPSMTAVKTAAMFFNLRRAVNRKWNALNLVS